MIKLHSDPLKQHKTAMWSTLIYPIHKTSKDGTLVRREYYTEDSLKEHGDKTPIAAYMCDYYVKFGSDGSKKYILTDDMIRKLPIRVKSATELIDKKTHEIVYLPTKWNTFRIIPVREMSLHSVVQPFLFQNSEPELYEFYVVTAFAALVGKCPIWISGYRGFGKSSVFKTMDLVFDKVPLVESPNTVPAFYKHIPDTGIMVLDEMTRKDSDSAYNIHYILNLAGEPSNSKVQVQTGGSAAHGTNVPKDTTNCSFVCLMNLYEDYDKKFTFAEYMFHNNVSLDRRYLKLRIAKGELDISQFSNWEPYTPEDKAELIKMAKTIEWYKPHYNQTKGEWVCGLTEEHDPDQVTRGFKRMGDSAQNTHRKTHDWLLKTYSVYSQGDDEVFNRLVDTLVFCMQDYKNVLRDDYVGEDTAQNGAETLDVGANLKTFDDTKGKGADKKIDAKKNVSEVYRFEPFKKIGNSLKGEVIKIK